MAAGSGVKIAPLEQFTLHPALGALGGSVNFTQANLFMVFGAALTLALLYYGSRPAALVPGRLQAAAEMAYSFVRDMAVDQIGPEGVRYFPFVFTLFAFVLMGNLIGLVPYGFTYTSHIAVTGALAVLVVGLVTIVGLLEHGWNWFGYFKPAGLSPWLMPLLIPIEVISYLSRIISLSVRLFANMVAGHAMMVVFGGFIVLLAGAGFLTGILAIAPFALNVVLSGFELLVALLQAYVFAILTCMYLHDAVHLH